MFTVMLGSIAAAAVLAGGPPPPITVSLNNGGQYNRGEYAQVQFRTAADGYALILQADQQGRIRVLFPLDPGDDAFIRGGKTYKLTGRDGRGAFYLDQAGGGGMVYAAWSSSPFRMADFVRGDHWDYGVFDQYNASDDPESQLTDVVLLMTSQAFDYAIDRYIVYTQAEVVSSEYPSYIGVSGWPWPTYYNSGWSIGISFGYPCCYNNWYGWYPGYGYGYGWGYAGWGYPGYGYGYPVYGYGYPGYGYGYPGYGYGGGYYPGYPYHPAYGGGYAGYRPYSFKPGGTMTNPGTPYRPRGDAFTTTSSVLQTTGYRGRSAAPGAGTSIGRSAGDAATISGHSDAGRRPTSHPTPQIESGRPSAGGTGTTSGGGFRGASSARRTGGSTNVPSGRASSGPSGGSGWSPNSGDGAAAPRARSESSPSGQSGRAHGWSSSGQPLPPVSSRPRAVGSNGSGTRGGSGPVGVSGGESRRTGPTGTSQPSGGSYGGQPSGRSSAGSPPPRSGGGGYTGGGGARGSYGGGGSPSVGVAGAAAVVAAVVVVGEVASRRAPGQAPRGPLLSTAGGVSGWSAC